MVDGSSRRTEARSAKVGRARQPSRTLANDCVGYGWQATRRFWPERAEAPKERRRAGRASLRSRCARASARQACLAEARSAEADTPASSLRCALRQSSGRPERSRGTLALRCSLRSVRNSRLRQRLVRPSGEAAKVEARRRKVLPSSRDRLQEPQHQATLDGPVRDRHSLSF
jgi:hypothetical protein